MTWRQRVRAVVDARRFQQAISAVIVLNAITLGCETSPALVAEIGGVLHVIDHVALWIFVVELVARLYAHRARFFADPWSWFDLIVISVSLLPHSGTLSVMRALRILRALRLISLVPSMRRVVSALLAAMPGMASITGLLVLVLYVAGVMATKLYGATAPEHFGDLGTSLFTLFQIMTADGWSDIARTVMDEHPSAWIFFVVYMLITTFVVLNLFIAIAVSAMENHVSDDLHADLERLEEREQATDGLVLDELRALRAEVRQLRGLLTTDEPVHGG